MPVRGTRDSFSIGVSILAGGLSARMGRDKARVRVGHRTMLGHARALARQLGLPARVIRRDLVPRCGPLGGIFTALKTSRADAELFLACDMPFVTAAFLEKVLNRLRAGSRAVFADVDGVAGFPLAVRVDCLPIVEGELRWKSFSLQTLARKLRAMRVRPARGRAWETHNVNTPADLAAARVPVPRARRRNETSAA